MSHGLVSLHIHGPGIGQEIFNKIFIKISFHSFNTLRFRFDKVNC